MTTPKQSYTIKGRGRHYPDPGRGIERGSPDGYPSVSNVLGIVDKPAIRWWHVKGALAAAWESRGAFAQMSDKDQAVNAFKSAPFKSSNRKADLGSAVHAVCAALASDAPMPSRPAEADPYCEQFLQFVADFDVDIIDVERTVISRESRYGGTFDLVATLDHNEQILLDIKTGSGVYDETALQLAAYKWADWYFTDGGLKKWTFAGRCAAVHLGPDFYELVPVDTSIDVFNSFVGLRHGWEFVKGPVGDNAILPATTQGD